MTAAAASSSSAGLKRAAVRLCSVASGASTSSASSGIISQRRLYSSAAQHINISSSSSPSSSKSPSSKSSASGKGRIYGQPLPHTHPHLFPRRPAQGLDPFLPPTHGGPHNLFSQPPEHEAGDSIAFDELTPGITAAEYEQRRRNLIDRLPEGSVVVSMSGRVKIMSGNIFYRFRQETNFWYLTGFQEPDAAVILEKNSSPRGYKMTLFVQPRDEYNETWNGPRTGVDGAQDIFGADEAIEMSPAALLSHLKQILPQYTHIYTEPPTGPTIPRTSSTSSSSSASRSKPNLLNFLSPPSPSGYDIFNKKSDFEGVVKLLGDTRRCHSLAREVEALRVRKSEAELRAMKKAADISASAMTKLMGFPALHRARHGKNVPISEGQLQATFEYECAMRGAQRPAYVPVVASGAHACTIHYVNNDHLVGPSHSGLVCIDAGCEMDGYASDITRAFPVGHELGGRLQGAHLDLYEAVLATLKNVTKLVSARAGVSLSELHRRSVELLRLELNAIGGFSLGHDTLERTLFPHYIGHYLGIDLHDTPSISRSAKLEDGMVITVEPGLYIPQGDARFPKEFWGLGIRIEDDVVVREDGNLILTANVPKEVADVEAACQGFWEPELDLMQRTSQPLGQGEQLEQESAAPSAAPSA